MSFGYYRLYQGESLNGGNYVFRTIDEKANLFKIRVVDVQVFKGDQV